MKPPKNPFFSKQGHKRKMLSSPLVSKPIFPSVRRSVSAQSLRSKFRPPLTSDAASTPTTASPKQERRSAIGGYLNQQGMATGTPGSLYEILEIPVGATSQEIKAAYRRLARVFHPDVAAIDRKDSSADDFMRIHAAYCTLSDPEKRAVYDGKVLRRRRRPLTTVCSGFSGYSGRNWETDQCW